jgi:type IV pilus assembly protein PilA
VKGAIELSARHETTSRECANERSVFMFRPRSPNRRRRDRAFTLIELLVVVLILAILMAVSMVPYLSAVADSQKKTCRANMQTIAVAVHAARVKSLAVDFSGYIAGGVTTASLPDLQTVPLCPSGGAYSLSNGNSGSATTFKVACNVAAHGSFEPGVDSN